MEQSAAETSRKVSTNKRLRVGIYVAVAIVVIASIVTSGWLLRYDLLAFKAFTDKNRYLPGELINLTARFTNNGIVPVTLTFMTSAMASFSVYLPNGSYVDTVPVFALMWVTHATISPGGAAYVKVHWQQDGGEGGYGIQPTYPIEYYVAASALSVEFHASATTSIFTISDTV